MSQTHELQVTLAGDREVVFTRAFDAPRDRVFRAWTVPDLVMRWMGIAAWPMVTCDIDLVVGGAIRYVWRNAEGAEMALRGTFREIVPPERLVHREIFDEDWTGGETEVTTLFAEADGRTTVTMTVRYASPEARARALETGMSDGMAECYRNLDSQLAGASGG